MEEESEMTSAYQFKKAKEAFMSLIAMRDDEMKIRVEIAAKNEGKVETLAKLSNAVLIENLIQNGEGLAKEDDNGSAEKFTKEEKAEESVSEIDSFEPNEELDPKSEILSEDNFKEGSNYEDPDDVRSSENGQVGRLKEYFEMKGKLV